jgi:hypothetical protein
MPQYLLTVTRKRRWMFQAIEIDGEPYWDGGYSGNPTITPLIRECESPLTDEPSDGDGARAARRGLDNHRPEGECGIFATT